VVRLTEPAFEDLQTLLRLDPQIVRWALKKMLLLERDPEAGQALHGVLIGWRKLVVGDRDRRVDWRSRPAAGT
jgi:mRNA interferase RelE/StbE